MKTVRFLVVLSAIVLSVMASSCDKDSKNGPNVTARGICVDNCIKACDADNDCNTAGGELCCQLGDDGSLCVDASLCPRFCSADEECKTDSGDACVRVSLAVDEEICEAPEVALKLCKDDSTCGRGEECCTIYKEPVCLPSTRCPKTCSASSECNTRGGEVCCTTLKLVDTTLAAAGLCVAPSSVTCPKSCMKSSDCDTRDGELCCEGICRTSCPKECDTSNECSEQICCKTRAMRSAWATNARAPGYTVVSGGNYPPDGDPPNCVTCGQYMENNDFTADDLCSESQEYFEDLLNCISNNCLSACQEGTGSESLCSNCVGSKCSTEYDACYNDR